MYDEEDLLSLSALEHLVFCARQCALIHIERVWSESQATVEGHHLHDRAHDSGTEVRGNVRIARGLRLRSLKLGLSGMADIVEFNACETGVALEGIGGLWSPFPVEYKRGRLRRERGYEVQLCAQALCLEEMLCAEVPVGALFYGKSARREDVAFDAQLRQETELAAQRLHELFRRSVTPEADYHARKCRACSLVDVCLPRAVSAKHDVAKYLARSIQENEATS